MKIKSLRWRVFEWLTGCGQILTTSPIHPELAPIEDTMTRPSADIASIADDSEEEDDLSKPCSACGAKPGAPCFDVDPDGARRESRGAFHAARIFGPGPVVVRHTGLYNEEGGGVFEVTTQADA
jgi:hypothetical protein